LSRCVHPIVCPPKYVVNDRFVRRPVPVIHPVVRVNRINVVDVPRNIVRPFTKNVVVHHGFARPRYGGYPGFGGYSGFGGRGLFGPGIF
jgi:spore coat protein D